jgi:hypothetical protein
VIGGVDLHYHDMRSDSWLSAEYFLAGATRCVSPKSAANG